jgi:cytoskeletal protein RodZ
MPSPQQQARYVLIFAALTYAAWEVPDTHHLVTVVLGVAFVVGSIPSLMYFLWSLAIFKPRPEGRHSSTPKSATRKSQSASHVPSPPDSITTEDAWSSPADASWHSGDTSPADTLAATPFSGARKYIP